MTIDVQIKPEKNPHDKLMFYLERSSQPDLRFDIDVDQDGRAHYEDRNRQCTGHTLRFELPAKGRYKGLSKPVEAKSEEVKVDLELQPRRVDWLEELKIFLRKHKLAVAIATAVLVIVLSIWLWPGRNARQTEILLTGKSKQTNVVLRLSRAFRVKRLVVAVNNNDPTEHFHTARGTNMIVEIVSLPRLRSVTTKVDDEEAEVHLIVPPAVAAIEDAGDHMNDAIVGMERFGNAGTTLAAEMTKRPADRDSGLLKITNNSLDYWRREYPARVRSLAQIDRGIIDEAKKQFSPGGTHADHQDLLNAMMPLLLKHIAEMKKAGSIGEGYEKELFDKYGKLPNALRLKD